jgi:hypothetical protein
MGAGDTGSVRMTDWDVWPFGGTSRIPQTASSALSRAAQRRCPDSLATQPQRPLAHNTPVVHQTHPTHTARTPQRPTGVHGLLTMPPRIHSEPAGPQNHRAVLTTNDLNTYALNTHGHRIIVPREPGAYAMVRPTARTYTKSAEIDVDRYIDPRHVRRCGPTDPQGMPERAPTTGEVGLPSHSPRSASLLHTHIAEDDRTQVTVNGDSHGRSRS